MNKLIEIYKKINKCLSQNKIKASKNFLNPRLKQLKQAINQKEKLIENLLENIKANSLKNTSLNKKLIKNDFLIFLLTSYSLTSEAQPFNYSEEENPANFSETTEVVNPTCPAQLTNHSLMPSHQIDNLTPIYPNRTLLNSSTAEFLQNFEKEV